MAPRIHPCICGYTCRTYPQMKLHRKACVPWQHRTDPVAIRRARHRITREAQEAIGPPREPVCVLCRRRSDHHLSTCPNSQSEQARRRLVREHGISMRLWRRILVVLAKRYESPPVTESAGRDPGIPS